MRNGIGEIVTQVMNTLATIEPLPSKPLQEACLLMRGLCVHDDLRREMSCAYENGRFFLKQSNLVGTLMLLSGKFQEYPKVASAALAAARNLITTEESVQVRF